MPWVGMAKFGKPGPGLTFVIYFLINMPIGISFFYFYVTLQSLVRVIYFINAYFYSVK